MTAAHILVVDDEPGDNELYCQALRGAGYEVRGVRDAEQALQLVREQYFDVIVLDLLIPKPDSWDIKDVHDVIGIELLRRFKAQDSTIQVIVITNGVEREVITRAYIAGARDFLPKPVDIPALLRSVARAIDAQIPLNPPRFVTPDWFVSSDALVEGCLQEAQIWARTNRPILIIGEAGVGKEALAELIHNNGRAARGKFQPVACGDLTATMDLFRDTEYLSFASICASAERGTLLLKDIHSLSYRQQTFIEPLIRPGQIGNNANSFANDVRIIATVTPDIPINTFWNQLYQELSRVTLKLPALRERKDDIIKIASSFLRRTRLAQDIAPEAYQLLQEHDYTQANIDELEHILKGAAHSAHGGTIQHAQILAQLKPALQTQKNIDPQQAERVKSLREQITISQKRLQVLENNAALHGAATDAAILIQIEQTRSHIQALQAELQELI